MYYKSAVSRMCKIKLNSFKCYCTKIDVEGPKQTADDHIFNKPGFSNYVELTELLKNNIIYLKDGLLIVNRPSGLKKIEPMERGFWQKKLVIPMAPCSDLINHLTFSGVLGRLRVELETPRLTIFKAPDRYMSGISILHYDDNVEKKLRKAFLPAHLPICTHLAVCIGLPFKTTDSTKLGITLKKSGKSSKAMFVKNYSKRAVITEKVFPFVIEHKVLSTNEKLNVSLVELRNNRNKWNSLRAYCSMRMLAPILGDNIYGSCTKVVQGVRVAVDPFSPAALLPVKIPHEILSALELHPKQQSVVPLHLHFVELDLTKYKKFGQICIARPSDHFLWTCDKLKLHVPEHYMTNHTTSMRYSVSPSALVDSSDHALETLDGEYYSDDDSEESERY